jgi:hypothetical protein
MTLQQTEKRLLADTASFLHFGLTAKHPVTVVGLSVLFDVELLLAVLWYSLFYKTCP